MKLKLRNKNKINLQNKMQMIMEIKEAIVFLEPELNSDDVFAKLIFILTTIADPILLNGLWNSTNELANKKVNEVTDLYCNFFSENETPNNN